MSENIDDAEDLIRDLDEIEETRKKEARVLTRLLDDVVSKKGHVVAIRNVMGVALEGTGRPVQVPSYVATHTLNWLGNRSNILMGSEMPFMEHFIEKGTGRVMVDEKNASTLAQRAPDWTRQPALTAYLLHDPHRKFGTILAVISPPWIDDPKHENWGTDGRAIKNSVEFVPLDSRGNIGLLNLQDVDVYALDGQHRIMGIRGLTDIKNGKLEIKKKEGKPTGKEITRDEFLSEFDIEIGDFQRIFEDQVSVEFIPAVIAGESRAEAAQRVRAVFVAINSNAKKIDKGEAILLDEADGFSIIARQAGILHPMFKAPKEASRVNWKNTSLPRRSPWITTLDALRDMAEGYIQGANHEMAESWRAKFKGQVPLRPKESELDDASDLFMKFLSNVQNLPVFRAVLSGSEIDLHREFPGKKVDGAKANLLLRPLGQKILARAVGDLVLEGLSIEEIFEKLRSYDQAGGFEAHKPENFWYFVTYEPKASKMIMSNRETAVDLFKYIVRGEKEEERNELKLKVKELRTGLDGTWVNFKGKEVSQDDSSEGSAFPEPAR